MLFKNGLPRVRVFDGIKSEDDGTVVIVGDLGGAYDKNRSLFRSVRVDKGAKLTINEMSRPLPALLTADRAAAPAC
jgi:hypothetical protein